MKKHSLMLALSPIFCAGAVAGLVATNNVAHEVKADSGVSGTISIDITGGDWATNSDGQNISVYFFNDSTNGWGSYEFAAQSEYVVFVDYELSFVPTGMIAVRYNPSNSESSWTSNRWNNKWNQTIDLTFTANSNIIIDSWNKDVSKNNATVGYAYIAGKGIDNGWKWTDPWINLNQVKLNGSNHVEYYLTRTFKQWDEFAIEINGGEWTTNVTYSSFVDAGDWGTKDNNIQYIGEGGTFALYYDRNSASIYITDPIAAEADEWAQVFLGVSSSSDTCTYSKSKWSSSSTSYATLSSDAKALFVAENHVAYDASTTTYLAKAVQRYDYVLELYGTSSYTDFMGRVSAGKIKVSHANAISGLSSNGGVIGLTAISLLAASGVVGVFFFRKRKAI